MKKIAIGIFLLWMTTTVQALPLGNPAEPNFLNRGVFWGGICENPCDPCSTWLDNWGVRVGYYGDFVFDRRLKVRKANTDDIHDTKIFTNAGYFVLNLGERLDIFGTVGVSKIRISQIEATWDTTLPFSSSSVGFLDTNTDFSWSVGARACLLKRCGFILGVEGQYFQTRPQFNRYYSTFFTGNAVFLTITTK